MTVMSGNGATVISPGGSRGRSPVIREKVVSSGPRTVVSGNGATVISAGTAANGSIRIGESPRLVEASAGNRAIEIYEPPEGRIVTERIVTEPAVEELQFETPNVMVCERIEEVLHIHEQDFVVEVPEIHHHKSTIYIPKYTEELVDVPVEVPQLHVREEIEVITEWREEVTNELRVPVVTVREVEKPVLKTHVETDTIIREFPVAIPTMEKVIQRPKIELKANVHYVKGHTDIKVHEPEYVEEQHIVQVPRVVPVPVEDYRVTTKGVVVPQIRRMETVVEVPEEKVIERLVEVPQVHTETTIIERPRFVQSDAVLSEDTGEDSGYIFARDALRQTRRQLEQVEREKEELGFQLELMIGELEAAEVFLDEELSLRRRLEVQYEQVQGKRVVEFGALSPSTVTTVGEIGEFSPASTSMSSPGRQNIHYEYKAETGLRPATSTVLTAGAAPRTPQRISASPQRISAGSPQRSTAAARAVSRSPQRSIAGARVSRSPQRSIAGARVASGSPARKLIANTVPGNAYVCR